MVKTENKDNPEYELIEVATQTETLIRGPDGNNLTVAQALLEVLNKLSKIEKNIIG